MQILRSFFIFCLMISFVVSYPTEDAEVSKLDENTSDVFVQGISVADEGSLPEEPSKVKINWAPVWDDIEESKEVGLRFEANNEKCGESSGKGLRNLIEQVKKILPLEHIVEIIHAYAQDPQIKALEKYLRSPEFKETTLTIENSIEFKLLQSYTCNILHLDILRMSRSLKENDEYSEEKKQGGITGLLLEINFEIPHEELKNLYKNLLKTDDELVKAIIDLKSEEFKQMSWNLIKNVPAYKEFLEKLKVIGVPVDEIRTYVEHVIEQM